MPGIEIPAVTIWAAVLSCIGAVLTGLGGVAVFFVIRLIKQLDQSERSFSEKIKEITGDVGKRLDKITDTVDNLSKSLLKLSTNIEQIEKESQRRHQEIQDRFKEHHEEIELTRTRVHYLFGKITAIKLQGQLNGWKFAEEDWIFPLTKIAKD